MFTDVSIHARARRATLRHIQSAVTSEVSIHARARRATCRSGSKQLGTAFQSTPARGGRPAFNPAARQTKLFQSTPARGGRLEVRRMSPSEARVSIHARARRATRRHSGPKHG